MGESARGRVIESVDPNERLKLWINIHYPATAW